MINRDDGHSLQFSSHNIPCMFCSSIQAFVRDLSQYAKSFVVRRIQESPTILKDAPDELIGTLATLLRFILVNAKDDDMLQKSVPIFKFKFMIPLLCSSDLLLLFFSFAFFLVCLPV